MIMFTLGTTDWNGCQLTLIGDDVDTTLKIDLGKPPFHGYSFGGSFPNVIVEPTAQIPEATASFAVVDDREILTVELASALSVADSPTNVNLMYRWPSL